MARYPQKYKKMYHFEYQSKHLVDVYRSLWQESDDNNVESVPLDSVMLNSIK